MGVEAAEARESVAAVVVGRAAAASRVRPVVANRFLLKPLNRGATGVGLSDSWRGVASLWTVFWTGSALGGFNWMRATTA